MTDDDRAQAKARLSAQAEHPRLAPQATDTVAALKNKEA
jgi:hypothetical protein